MSVSGTAKAIDELPAGFDCVITPSQTVELGSAASGLVSEMFVDRGVGVQAGQIVALLESQLEKANLEIAKMKAESDAEVNLRISNLELDLKTEKRLLSLGQSDVATLQDIDRVTRDANSSAWRMLQAKDGMKIYGLEKTRAEITVDRRTIRSPIDGVVVARLVEPGEYIDSAPLLRIVNLDRLHVEAILPMRLFGQIQVGMSARVYSEQKVGEALNATVDVVDPMGDAGSGTFGARLLLSNLKGDIPAGVKCRVQFQIEDALPAG